MGRKSVQDRESMREHRFFRGEGGPLPFLFLGNILESGENHLEDEHGIKHVLARLDC